MPKYYCDYCDTYLTHDSPSVRKTHCGGRKHKENVCTYYEKWLADQVQKLVDDTTAAFKAGKIQTNPFSSGATAGPVGGGAMIPPPISLQAGRGIAGAPNPRGALLPTVGKPPMAGAMIPPPGHPMHGGMGPGMGPMGPVVPMMGGPLLPGMRPMGGPMGGPMMMRPMGGGGPGPGPMMPGLQK